MLITNEEIDVFFNPANIDIAPEVGSRALQNLLIGNSNVFSHWEQVQQDIYQYSVIIGLDILVIKIVLWNYLAIEVTWE